VSADASPVWLYAPDLLDRSRIVAAHPDATVVNRPEALFDAPERATVLVDLRRAGVLEVLPRLGHARTIGFASHVDDELIAAARAAGCDDVLPRSVFFRRWGTPSGGEAGEMTSEM
jgi:hypothetical protein